MPKNNAAKPSGANIIAIYMSNVALVAVDLHYSASSIGTSTGIPRTRRR
jgi:hypothetical protein